MMHPEHPRIPGSNSPFNIRSISIPGARRLFNFGTKRKTMHEGCVFCNIVRGDEPARVVFQNERLIAFWDRDPAADLHLLVCPKACIKDINSLLATDIDLVQEMHTVGAQLLIDMHPSGKHKIGYHVPPFTSVNHLHLHCFGLPHKCTRAFKYQIPQVWMTAEALELQLAPKATPSAAATSIARYKQADLTSSGESVLIRNDAHV